MQNDTFRLQEQAKVSVKGTLSSLSQNCVTGYYSYLTARSCSSRQNWLPSVQNLSKIIQQDPVVRMNWEYGISKCTKTLIGKNGDDVLSMIDSACKTPPAYSRSDFVGFPINAIFLQFMQNQNGRFFFSHEKINLALKAILSDYTAMLESKDSLQFMNDESPSGWFCKEAMEELNYDQYICSPEKPHFGFNNWNEWFLRLFKPGMRQVGAGSPNGVDHENIIVNSCESTPLTLPMQPQRDVKKTDNFWLKDNVYSLSDMFAAGMFDKYHLVDTFVGGTVYQAYLNAINYHRWHAPVNGVIEDVYLIPGSYYLNQSQFIPYDQVCCNNSQSFLSAVATRLVVVIQADNKNIGKIAIIYIGMAEVSSCIATVKIGDHVKKGQEIGHFEFGGSSHAMVFEKKAKLLFNSRLYTHEDNGQVKKANQQYLSSFLAEIVPQRLNQ